MHKSGSPMALPPGRSVANPCLAKRVFRILLSSGRGYEGIWVAPSDPLTLYLQGSEILFRSADGGATWTDINKHFAILFYME